MLEFVKEMFDRVLLAWDETNLHLSDLVDAMYEDEDFDGDDEPEGEPEVAPVEPQAPAAPVAPEELPLAA